MATKKTVRKSSVSEPEQFSQPTDFSVSPTPAPANRQISKMDKKWLWLGAALVVIGLYWYRTNTWPVVAMVGWKPITRFEVNKELYKQSGRTMVDAMITERLVREELKNKGISVTDEEVSTKLDEIAASVGSKEDFEKLVADRGLTMDDVKKQLKLQMSIEKAVGDNASVSAEELDAYVKQNENFLSGTTAEEKRAGAAEMLKQQKLQGEIGRWVEEVKNNGKVWRLEPAPEVTAE